jgi:hypothetical protein
LPPLPARARHTLALTPLLAALLLALAPAGAAAKRKVPFGFMGVNLTPLATEQNQLTQAELNRQAASMARNGVESLRTDFRWFSANPARGKYDWRLTDAVMTAAAKHGLRVLPTIQLVPRWASSHPNSNNYFRYKPKKPRLIAPFLKQLVKRYGPRGRFFKQHRTLPYDPIHEWQIWNEPELKAYWVSKYPRDFIPMFRAGANAIHKADRHAKVVLPALAGEIVPKVRRAWEELRDFYRAGLKKQFDVIALDQYVTGQKVSARVSAARLAQTVFFMNTVALQNHDEKTPIYLTEMGWPATPKNFPKRLLTNTEVTRRGQIARLKAFYTRMARGPRHRLARAYWFTWASSYGEGGIKSAFDFDGLNQWVPGEAFSPLPVLAAYRKTAIKLEGCRKGTNARRCK